MDPTKTSLDAPPSYREQATGSRDQSPITLVLDGQTIRAEDDASTPLYHLSRSVTALKQEPSSIQLDRVDQVPPEKATSSDKLESRNTHLFYLVHPINARYRTDKPAYYGTSNPATTASNFVLQPARSMNPLHTPEFTVSVSPGRTAESDVSFDNAKDQQPLFTVKKKWSGGHYVWRSSSGSEIAIEESVKDGQGTRKLVVSESLDYQVLQTLVAAWCLRCWHDVAESKEARRDGTFVRSARLAMPI